jgi:hypothetical protein
VVAFQQNLIASTHAHQAMAQILEANRIIARAEKQQCK